MDLGRDDEAIRGVGEGKKDEKASGDATKSGTNGDIIGVNNLNVIIGRFS